MKTRTYNLTWRCNTYNSPRRYIIRVTIPISLIIQLYRQKTAYGGCYWEQPSIVSLKTNNHGYLRLHSEHILANSFKHLNLSGEDLAMTSMVNTITIIKDIVQRFGLSSRGLESFSSLENILEDCSHISDNVIGVWLH